VSDSDIVKAAIYPAIGVARVGNSPEEFFIGPEVTTPENRPSGYYKDSHGALKRQAARFRVYGLDAHGRVIKELDAKNAKIQWRVHVANKKAAWYEFDVAMDIAQAQAVPLRNANFTGKDREQLVIDPGPRVISGMNESGKQYRFDSGKFIGEPVYLGELRTDERGRLLFLGGHGVSRSPYHDNPPITFANNDGWHDDVSDGPVDAEVTFDGRKLACEGAWVVTAPPNYAPDIISVQTMHDVIFDALSGLYTTPAKKPSFTNDIYPLLQQFSMNQWVNQGFYVGFGYAQAYDFADPEWIRRLSTVTKGDAFVEYRRQVFNYFRPPNPTVINEQLWPWMYGDNMNVPATTPNGYFSITNTLYTYLQSWVAGNFEQDWNPSSKPPKSIDEIKNPQAQADELTKAALWYCLGGPFHPGCEMTWPMRLSPMYTAAYRIRRRTENNPEPDWGPVLTPELFQNQEYFTTPSQTFWNTPGDLTRWMALPWQTDTASCRAGYEPTYDPLIPTFWPAHVPNTVLTSNDYAIVINEKAKREERLDAFNRRASWYRILGIGYLNQIANMIHLYGDLGVVEYRPGVKNDPDFPAQMYVESRPFAPGGTVTAKLAKATAVQERLQKADAADDIPTDRGLIVGRVGRGARRR